MEGTGGILLYDLLLARNFHLINNLSNQRVGAMNTGTREKTHRINIQILFLSIRKQIRNGHCMVPIGESSPREKRFPSSYGGIPIIGERYAVKGGTVRSVVVPLGAVYPNRCSVESH